MLDAELLRILACPQCRGPLLETERGLGCTACSLLYPIMDDIPVLLPEEALPWQEKPSPGATTVGPETC